MAFFTFFALTFVWMMAPAAMADPVKEMTTPPSETQTDTDEVELPEV